MTTSKEQRKENKLDVCDDCLLVAYDMGLEGEVQASTMAELGRELPDHICILTEEPDEGFICDCACKVSTGRT
jgi:hypothetical protein